MYTNYEQLKSEGEFSDNEIFEIIKKSAYELQKIYYSKQK